MANATRTQREVTLNTEQGLYVIPEGHGYSCLGFDVCRDWTLKYADWLGVALPEPMPHATLEAYALYEGIAGQCSERARTTGQRCNAMLTPELVGLEGKRVEVTDKYDETRRFYVGKSTGWAPIHLEIAGKTSHGGGAVTGAPFKSVRVIGRSR